MTTVESSDIETYNAFVQATADAAPIGEWGLEWKAIAGTEAVNARENTATDPDNDTSVPIFLLDGTELVPSYAALWNGEVDRVFRYFDVSEFGVPINSPDPPLLSVWTGTGADGLPFFLSGSIEGGPLGSGTRSVIGFGDFDSVLWFNGTNGLNELPARMYAMSEMLVAVPEPVKSSHFLAFLAILSGTYQRQGHIRKYQCPSIF